MHLKETVMSKSSSGGIMGKYVLHHTNGIMGKSILVCKRFFDVTEIFLLLKE